MFHLRMILLLWLVISVRILFQQIECHKIMTSASEELSFRIKRSNLTKCDSNSTNYDFIQCLGIQLGIGKPTESTPDDSTTTIRPRSQQARIPGYKFVEVLTTPSSTIPWPVKSGARSSDPDYW